MDAGYDDIDFVADISSEELQDIGITKKGRCVCVCVRHCVHINTVHFQDHLYTLAKLNQHAAFMKATFWGDTLQLPTECCSLWFWKYKS